MNRKIFSIAALIILASLAHMRLYSRETKPVVKNILYLNSYSVTYPWSDSLVSGIQEVITKRNDINLFVEFLDVKRFGRARFNRLFELYLDKYKNTRFAAVIASDNDALDFMMMYGDSLAPDVPVIFCGINNPQDYPLDNSRYYGLLDAIDLRTEFNLIVKLMPEIKKLYFITDSSTTSLVNLRNVRELEPEYSDQLEFVYIHHYPLDSLMETVARFEKGNAIALINYFQDENGIPLNPDPLFIEISKRTPVPIFIDSETLLGKGIAGGIINNGVIHGRETANLALSFIDNPRFKPDSRVTMPKGKYYFDFAVLEKFGITLASLPKGSVIINKPGGTLSRYIKYITVLMAAVGVLIVVVLFMYFSSKRRKKAEELVKSRFIEIQEKNVLLEMAHEQLNKMNLELEQMNVSLSHANEALTQANKKSEESDKLKSAFLANMSHEIRTPLNAIIGFSALLNESDLSEKERNEYFRIIGSHSDQLLRIIDDILDLSKLEAGQLKINIEQFPVHDLLSELVNSFTQSIDKNKVNILISETSTNNIVMKSDRSRLRQIFRNLISNAVKFTRQGIIEVGYNIDNNGYIVFYVKDTGIGIHSDDMKNLFHRFWKADARSERNYSGAGIGLAICKKLCEAIGGRIWVESEPGMGTSFFIEFEDYMIKSTSPQQHKTLPVALENTDLKGFTVAIAEDERNNMYLLTRILRHAGVDIITFTTGREIVDYFRENPDPKVNLILMDIKMPEMDGIEASKIIRDLFPCIPIIAQTAYVMVEDMEKLKSSSFDDYVSKPIQSSLLIEKIKKMLHPEKV